MPHLRYLPAFVTNYRIGYTLQRPYPWRWTTPIAMFVLFASIPLLACLNVPLSAYETIQEFTYFPNSTLPALPMSNIIPAFLHASTATFSPVNLNMGQTFRLNNSVFAYTITSAFDAVDNGRPVISFPYSNTPFSSNCDVTSITATVSMNLGEFNYEYYSSAISGSVTCTSPTLFQMNWAGSFPVLDAVGYDLQQALWYGVLGLEVPSGNAEVTVTARPCCNCTEAIAHMSEADIKLESANLLQPPCSTQPARFVGVSGNVHNTTATVSPWGVSYTWTGPNTTDLFAGLEPTYRQGYIGDQDQDLSALETTFQNVFQVAYQLVRRDLGVILENQIDNSPEMLNKSIASVDVPQSLLGTSDTPFNAITMSAANRIRAAMSNDTMMAQWQNSSLAINQTDRVPVFEYLRPVPRLKPLGSAITSVFVSTFAMVSTAWTVFTIVAKAFVRASDKDPNTSLLIPLHEDDRIYEEIDSTESSPLTVLHHGPMTV
ncbi:hypothetical protein K438DRAFT_1858948 [Mycena galopus ATCC 62051]|nr:hypothetical protein K438DRAFT_1858948 [Mycena galopus ATCC 62051]